MNSYPARILKGGIVDNAKQVVGMLWFWNGFKILVELNDYLKKLLALNDVFVKLKMLILNITITQVLNLNKQPYGH